MRVKLFNSNITVEVVESRGSDWVSVFYPNGIDDDVFFLGKCYHSTDHIVVSNNQSNAREKQIVVHELIHAILFETGHEHDEGTIDAISTGIINLLQNNPKLIEYLVSQNSLAEYDDK